MISISSGDWQLQGINAILFDKDGTFVDSHKYWGRIITCRSDAICRKWKLDSTCIEQLELVMGFSRQTKRLLSHGPIALVSREKVIECVMRYLELQNISTLNHEILNLFNDVHHEMESVVDHIELIPGALPLFKMLHSKGVALAVVTTDAIKNTEIALDRFNLKKYFSVVVGRESSDQPKASGVPAKIALAAIGASAQETICIGDAPMDASMANQSGCLGFIGVSTGQITAQDLLKYTSYVVSNLSELRLN